MSFHFTAARRSGQPDTCHSIPPSRSIETTGPFFFCFVLFFSPRFAMSGLLRRPLARCAALGQSWKPPLARLSVTAAPPVLCVAGFFLTRCSKRHEKRHVLKISRVNWSVSLSLSGSPAESSIDFFCLSSFLVSALHIKLTVRKVMTK